MLERCRKNGKPAYRWGSEGKPFTYTAGDKESRERAKRRAEAQGRQMKANKRKDRK
jgi:hypothetical protein